MSQFMQLTFKSSVLVNLIRFNLTMNNKAAGKKFTVGQDTYLVEQVYLLNNSFLRHNTPTNWAFDYLDDFDHPGVELVTTNRVEIVQAIRVNLAKIVKVNGQETLDEGGSFDGNLVMLLDVFAVDRIARFSISVSKFETQGMDQNLRNGLSMFLHQAFSAASTIRDFNIPFYPHSEIVHAGIAASSNGALVALRMQLGSHYYSKVVVAEWKAFLAGNIPASLGSHDWGVLVSGDLVVRLVNDQISAGMEEHTDEFRVTSGPASSWAPSNGVPQVHAEWWGYAVKACVLTQSDIFYHVESSVTFSLPQANTLETNSHVDWHGNEWDIFWCVLVSGLIGGVVFALIGAAFGPVGAGVGAAIGLIGGIIAAIVVAETYTPDFGQANCTQQGHDLTCDIVLSEQARTAGPGLVMNITDIAGPPEGLLLLGDLPVKIPVVFEAVPLFEVSPFAWIPPIVTCGSYTQQGFQNLLNNLEKYVQPLASVKVSNSGQGTLTLNNVTRISDDPFNVFPPQNIQVAPYNNAYWVTVSASLNDAYKAQPYPCILRLDTNAGSHVVDLGSVPALTQEIIDQLRKTLIAIISDCNKLMDGFWKATHHFNLKWLVDPPPGDRVERLWMVEVNGLQPGEVLQLEAGEAVAGVEVRANPAGVARTRLRSNLAEIGLGRTQAGTRLAAPTTIGTTGSVQEGEGEQERHIATRQADLVQGAILQFPSPFEDFDLRSVNGAAQLAVLVAGRLQLYDLSDLNSPGLVLSRSLPAGRGLRFLPQGLLVWGESGLAVEDLEMEGLERLLSQPVLAAETLGREIFLAGHEGLLAYDLINGGQRRVEGGGRITSLAQAGPALVACDGRRLFRLDRSDPASDQFHSIDYNEPVEWVTASPLFSSGWAVWAELGDGQGRLLEIDPEGGVSVVARYERTPWFARARASGRTLVYPGSQPNTLEVRALGSSITA